ncbi:MAG: hypothetical protein NVSMB9_09060 [Isosphaeraceae bacterium]
MSFRLLNETVTASAGLGERLMTNTMRPGITIVTRRVDVAGGTHRMTEVMAVHAEVGLKIERWGG